MGPADQKSIGIDVATNRMDEIVEKKPPGLDVQFDVAETILEERSVLRRGSPVQTGQEIEALFQGPVVKTVLALRLHVHVGEDEAESRSHVGLQPARRTNRSSGQTPTIENEPGNPYDGDVDGLFRGAVAAQIPGEAEPAR